MMRLIEIGVGIDIGIGIVFFSEANQAKSPLSFLQFPKIQRGKTGEIGAVA